MKKRSRKQLRAIFKRIRSSPEYRIHTPTSKKRSVGLLKVFPTDSKKASEVTLIVAKSHRGQGLGTQAYRHARKVVPLASQKLTANIGSKNIASIKAARKAGFKRIGRPRSFMKFPKKKYYIWQATPVRRVK
jgi:RimJ/RimL family protein N-acetyltransferase